MTEKLSGIISFLDNFLEIDKYSYDISVNGLQVGGREEIKRVLLSVDASLDVISFASRNSYDLIIVHHGLIWKTNNFRITKDLRKKIEILIKTNINLAAYHLPLDFNKEIGNNIMLCKELEGDIVEFGEKEPYVIFDINLLDTKHLLDKISEIFECKPILYNFGKNKVERIIFSSGSGGSIIFNVLSNRLENDIDLVITGEVPLYLYNFCKENRINLVELGHYNSEKLGIMELKNVLSKKYSSVEFSILFEKKDK